MALKLPDTGAEVLANGRRMVLSAARNAGPILEVLRAEGVTGRLLEIASGSGLHAGVMAGELPGVDWQPTDVEPGNSGSIAAWARQSGGTIRPPRALNVTRAGWGAGLGRFRAVLCVNLLHLVPEAGAAAFLDGLGAVVEPGGAVFLYGPFLRDGRATSPGDAAFDASLRAQDPAIGYKDVAWVEARLRAQGLRVARQEMPANNLMVIAQGWVVFWKPHVT